MLKRQRKVLKILLLISFIFCGQSVFSVDLNAFKKRFQINRDEQGNLTFIRDTSIQSQFSIQPYIEFIKETLLNEQSLMSFKTDYDRTIYELLGNEKENFIGYGSLKNDSQSKIVVDSLRELEKIDFDQVFNNSKFKEVIAKFESKLSDALLKVDPTVVAHAMDKDFFYQRKLADQALTWGLNFAKDRLSSLPILNTAFYVLVRVKDLLKQRRLYHQNMLLHYIENVPASQLGITDKEANHIMSSIYESRIQWFAFWESRNAQSTWDKFGVNNFYSSIRTNNNRFRDLRGTYSSIGSRLNYAFQDVVKTKDRIILNLFHTKHMFSSDLSVAYNRDKPKSVRRVRVIAQLAELGLSFLPIPSFIKRRGEDFIKSYYKEQTLIEGALYGYFEMTGNKGMLDRLKNQILNPFEKL